MKGTDEFTRLTGLNPQAFANFSDIGQLFEVISQAFVTLNREARFTYLNAAAERLMLKQREELLGKCVWDVFPDLRNTEIDTNLRRCLVERIPISFNFPSPDADRWYEVTLHPTKEGLAALFHDITALRRAQLELKESEARFRHMADAAPVMVWTAAPDGNCTYLSASWQEFTGQTLEEGLGQGWLDAVHPEDRARSEEEFSSAKKKRRAVHTEYRLRRHDGKYRWVMDSAKPWLGPGGEFLGYIGSVLDIDDRKRAEEIQRANEAETRRLLDLHRATTESLAEGLYTVDAQGVVTSINPEAERMFGWTAAELIGRRMHDVTHHSRPDGSRFPIEECVGFNVSRTGTPVKGHEDIFIRKDGSFFPVRLSSAPLRGLSGEIAGLVVVFEDISKRKQEELTQARLASIVESAADVMISFDLEGIITSWNPAAEKLYGYKPEEILGQRVTRLVPPELRAAEAEILREVAEGHAVGPLETVRMGRGGVRHDVLLTVSPMRDETGRVVGGSKVHRDITEWKRARLELQSREEQLRLSLKSARGASWDWDILHGVQSWSDDLYHLLGIEPGSVEPSLESWLARVYPEDRERCLLATQTALIPGNEYEAEFRIARPDGNLRWLYSRGNTFFDERGAAVRMAGVVLDITDRKVAEEKLRESEAQLALELAATQQLQSVSTQLIAEGDPNVLYEKILDAAIAIMGSQFASLQIAVAEQGERLRLRLLGYRGFTPEAARFWEWVDFESDSACGAALRSGQRILVPDVEMDPTISAGADLAIFRQTGIRGVQSTPLVSRGGVLLGMISTHWANVYEPSERDLRMFDVLVRQVADLLERQQAEQKLRASETRYRALTELSPQFVFTARPDGYVTYVNQFAVDFTGRTPEQMRADGWSETIRPDVRQQVYERWTEAIRGGVEYNDLVPIRRHDGEYGWFKARALPIRDESGRIAYWIGVALDVSAEQTAQEELRRSMRELEDMKFALDQHAIVATTDARGIIKYVNDKFCEISKYPREELLGQDHRIVNSGYHSKDFIRNLWQTITRGEVWKGQIRNRAKDGSIYWVDTTIVPFLDERGKPYQYLAVRADITASKQAIEAIKESELRFRALADTAPVLIWVNGPDGCEFVNREYLRYLGAEMSEVQGLGWKAWVHPEDVDAYFSAYEEAGRRRAPFDAQVRLRGADGEYRWFASRGVPRIDTHGEFLGYVGSSVDIDAVKKTEEMLRIADQNKDHFLATMGHELRNPLAAIETGVTLLRSQGYSARKRKWTEEMLERQVQQLRRLVDDLLDVTRITHGKLVLQREVIDLRDVVRSAEEVVRHQAEEAGHKLRVSTPVTPVWVNGDAARLEQVIVNLLNNAVKYSPEPGRIELSLKRNSKEAVLVCRDHGMGLTPELRERMFEPFVQGVQSTASGLGIGLALVRRLTEMHGGHVEASSDGPGSGSEFTVHLPLMVSKRAPRPNGGPLKRPPQPAVGGLRVLVVDDNRDLAQAISLVLEERGHQVMTAFDGESGLALAKELRPDIALLDLGMPGLDGYDLAARIREDVDLADVMLVAVSGFKPSDDERAQRARFDAHLVKPLKLEDLVPFLKRTLENKRARIERPANSQRILLVEDHAEVGALTVQALRRRGHKVDLAASGAEALVKARHMRPSVVMCDMHLPDMSGLEVARALRAEESLAPLCLIAVTADDIGNPDSLRPLFDYVVTKPPNWNELAKIFEQAADNQPASKSRPARAV